MEFTEYILALNGFWIFTVFLLVTLVSWGIINIVKGHMCLIH